MRNVLCAAALASTMILSALPAASAATVNAYAVSYNSLYGPGAGGVPFQGELKIAISDSGIIRGYYELIGEDAHRVTVIGGRDADGNVWLHIGGRFHLNVTGHLDNGVLDGGAIDDRGTQYSFTAKPATP